jgi:hypothetical protein
MFTAKLIFKMHISIKNLGIVETAEIELSGITVLSGYNDTGKSFIGKLIFSIVHTIKNAIDFDETNTLQQLFYNLDRIRMAHWRAIPPNFSKEGYVLSVHSLGNRIIDYLNQNRLSFPDKVLELIREYKAEILIDLESFNEKNSRIKPEELSPLIKDIETNFELAEIVVSQRQGEENLYKNYFELVIINGIFGGNINSLGKDSSLEVTIVEGSTILVSIIVEQNRVKSFKYSRSNPLFKDDATLIETPTIISLDKYFYPIGRSQMRDREFPIPYHDLLLKMRTGMSNSPSFAYPEIIEEINEIINGEVDYDISEKSFIYKKKNSQKISSENIATGIKSFAILQMLLKNEHLSPYSILILDEPEVHLHPQWEILYAKILFSLSKWGVLILLTTHSSYFLQALIHYATDMNMEDKVHLYFGEKIQDKTYFTSFKDVTSDPNPIFKALAKPMQDIYTG